MKTELLKRSEVIELLESYSKFLEKGGYIDTDYKTESPYAIDEFLKTISTKGDEVEKSGEMQEDKKDLSGMKGKTVDEYFTEYMFTVGSENSLTDPHFMAKVCKGFAQYFASKKYTGTYTFDKDTNELIPKTTLSPETKKEEEAVKFSKIEIECLLEYSDLELCESSNDMQTALENIGNLLKEKGIFKTETKGL